MAPKAEVRFRNGRYLSEAVAQAKDADVVVVFATQWAAEGIDQPDLSLPEGQDALIAAVAAANSNTVVVLETGGPVTMPWLDKTAAVLAAWYPGARGGEAIASVLFGETNPSGHLPVTFPISESLLPRPVLDGAGLELPAMGMPPAKDARLETNYDIEGSDVGYRWNARQGQKALFPFGHGLSFTTFATSGLHLTRERATFTVRNSGKRDGATIAQLYLVSRSGDPKQRLVGFERVALGAGAAKKLSFTLDPRLLADWQDGGWSMPAGAYEFALGDDAEHLGRPISVRMPARRWHD
jgi:beta-glucosidase